MRTNILKTLAALFVSVVTQHSVCGGTEPAPAPSSHLHPSSSTSSSTSPASEVLRLALNWKPEPEFGGFYAAEKNESFKKRGLSVQILQGGSGTPTVQMLAAGQVEYAIVSADEIILAHDRGATDVVALFAVYQTNPQGVMVHAEAGYPNLKALFQDKSATIQWQSGLPYAQFLIRKYGPIGAHTVPYSGGIAPFQQDPHIAQQCFITAEPLSATGAGLKVKTFLAADEGYNPYTTVVATTRKRKNAHPEEVQNMIAALRDGWRSYLDNPESINELMRKLNPSMSSELFSSSAAAQKDLIETPWTKTHGLGKMSTERWETLLGQLTDLKLIHKKIKAQDLYDF